MRKHSDTPIDISCDEASKEPTLAERLAEIPVAEIDAMSDQEVAGLMDATAGEIATEPAWSWREAAKAATDEYEMARLSRDRVRSRPFAAAQSFANRRS